MASKKFITLAVLFILMLLFASSKVESTGVADQASKLGSMNRKLKTAEKLATRGYYYTPTDTPPDDAPTPDTPDTPPDDAPTPDTPDTPPPDDTPTPDTPPPDDTPTPDTPPPDDTPTPDTPPSL